MTDKDLVKALRAIDHMSHEDCFLQSPYFIKAADRIEALTAQLESTLRDRKAILEERDRTFALMLARAEKAETEGRKYEGAWMTAEGKLADAEAENARLREDLEELDFLRHEGGPDSVAAMEAELKRLRAVLSDIKTASVCSVSRHVAASALGEAAA